MSQGAVKNGRGIRLRAWGVSVCAHAVVLSVFGAVQLSQPKAEVRQAGAVVSVGQAAALAERPAVAPKPKVQPAEQRRSITRTNEAAPKAGVSKVFGIPKQDSPQQIELSMQSIPSQTSSTVSAETLPAQTEFFGSTTGGRRICYVVDCSGSMQGLWQQVQAELYESIGQLQPDQYFSVIVFGSGSILESGGGWLVRATERTKKDAHDFIASVQPRGATNAADALEYAIKIRDRSGAGPAVIYFLTDGFELSEKDNFRFAHQVLTMLKTYGPKTQINTIGFWPEERDRKLLEMIAKDSGGEFVEVGEGAGKK